MSINIIYSNGKTQWRIKKAWCRPCFHVYEIQYLDPDDKKGSQVWYATFRDRDEAVYWARFGNRRSPEPAALAPDPPKGHPRVG